MVRSANQSGQGLALAEINSKDAASALTSKLADSDPVVRVAAALALAALRDPVSIPALAHIVADWDDAALERCRRAALHTLVSFRMEEAALELAHALTMGGPRPLDLHDRSALLAVAYAEPSGVAAPRVVRTLVRMLAHEDHRVAERASALLMLFPSESNRPLARTLRTAARTDVRRRAAQALGACRQDMAVAALVTALEDADAGVRASAVRSLGAMRDPATASALQAAGGDGDEGVREAARSALHKLGVVASATSLAAGFGLFAQRSPG
jgi:HEAT repeat protein